MAVGKIKKETTVTTTVPASDFMTMLNNHSIRGDVTISRYGNVLQGSFVLVTNVARTAGAVVDFGTLKEAYRPATYIMGGGLPLGALFFPNGNCVASYSRAHSAGEATTVTFETLVN